MPRICCGLAIRSIVFCGRLVVNKIFCQQIPTLSSSQVLLQMQPWQQKFKSILIQLIGIVTKKHQQHSQIKPSFIVRRIRELQKSVLNLPECCSLVCLSNTLRQRSEAQLGIFGQKGDKLIEQAEQLLISQVYTIQLGEQRKMILPDIASQLQGQIQINQRLVLKLKQLNGKFKLVDNVVLTHRNKVQQLLSCSSVFELNLKLLSNIYSYLAISAEVQKRIFLIKNRGKKVSAKVTRAVLQQQLYKQLGFIQFAVQQFKLAYPQQKLTSYKQIFSQVQLNSFRYAREHLGNQALIRPNKTITKINDLDSQYVTIFQPDIYLIRRLYCTQQKLRLKSVKVLTYQDSIEQTAYHQAGKAQQKIIQIISAVRKGGIIVQDAWARRSQISYDSEKGNQRVGKGKAYYDTKGTLLLPGQIQKHYIVIDKRQFKSSLPSKLYHFGFEIVPKFLEIGDYWLTDKIVIQRKNVVTQDLQESVRVGRLFSQLKRMAACHQQCYLLVQFSGQEFSLAKIDTATNQVTGQLYKTKTFQALLSILGRFPSVQVLWSLNLQMTCEMFKHLKRGKPQPDFRSLKERIVDEANQLGSIQNLE